MGRELISAEKAITVSGYFGQFWCDSVSKMEPDQFDTGFPQDWPSSSDSVKAPFHSGAL